MTCEHRAVSSDWRSSTSADETVDTITFERNAKHSCVHEIFKILFVIVQFFRSPVVLLPLFPKFLTEKSTSYMTCMKNTLDGGGWREYKASVQDGGKPCGVVPLSYQFSAVLLEISQLAAPDMRRCKRIHHSGIPFHHGFFFFFSEEHQHSSEQSHILRLFQIIQGICSLHKDISQPLFENLWIHEPTHTGLFKNLFIRHSVPIF